MGWLDEGDPLSCLKHLRREAVVHGRTVAELQRLHMYWRCFDRGTHNRKLSLLRGNSSYVTLLMEGFSPSREESNWELQQELRTGTLDPGPLILRCDGRSSLSTPFSREGRRSSVAERGRATPTEGEDVG